MHSVVCDHCGASAILTQPGRFCSPRHRTYAHRDALKAQRLRLAAEAEQALATGDPAALEAVARSAVAILTA